jgi:hypothetical protein
MLRTIAASGGCTGCTRKAATTELWLQSMQHGDQGRLAFGYVDASSDRPFRVYPHLVYHRATHTSSHWWSDTVGIPCWGSCCSYVFITSRQKSVQELGNSTQHSTHPRTCIRPVCPKCRDSESRVANGTARGSGSSRLRVVHVTTRWSRHRSRNQRTFPAGPRRRSCSHERAGRALHDRVRDRRSNQRRGRHPLRTNAQHDRNDRLHAYMRRSSREKHRDLSRCDLRTRTLSTSSCNKVWAADWNRACLN